MKIAIYKYGYVALWVLSIYQFWMGYGNAEMFTVLGIITILIIFDNAYLSRRDSNN